MQAEMLDKNYFYMVQDCTDCLICSHVSHVVLRLAQGSTVLSPEQPKPSGKEELLTS